MRNEEKEVNIWERNVKLLFMIGKMLLDGTRDPYRVADTLQAIVDNRDYFDCLKRVFENNVISTLGGEVIIHELTKDATRFQMLKCIGEKRRHWINRGEVLAFANQHKDLLGAFGNFFELEGGYILGVSLDTNRVPCISSMTSFDDDSPLLAKYHHQVFSLK